MWIKTTVFTLVLMVLSPFVHAQQVCLDVKEALVYLKKEYNEHPHAFGTLGEKNKYVMVLFLNKDTGSYTIVSVDKSMACLVVSGEDFQFFDGQTESY